MAPQRVVRKAGHYIENGTDITEILTSSELQRVSNSKDQLPDRYIPKPYIYVLKKLGGGGQGVVYLAELSSKPILRRLPAYSVKALFAIKLIPILANGNIPRELSYLQRFKGSHPRLCLLEAFSEVPGHHALYFGFNDAGDLWHLIQGFRMRGEIFPEAFIWHVLGQLVEAVYFLQNPQLEEAGEWQLWHRDIKPENIFLKWPSLEHSTYPSIQLGDFGCAHANKGEGKYSVGEFIGTAPYAAPEAVGRQEYSAATDIWGIGSVLHEMIHFYPPIAQRRSNLRSPEIYLHCQKDPAGNVVHSCREASLKTPREVKECPPHYSQLLQGLFAACLEFDPEKRADIYSLRNVTRRWAEETQVTLFRPLPLWFQKAHWSDESNDQNEHIISAVQPISLVSEGFAQMKARASDVYEKPLLEHPPKKHPSILVPGKRKA